MLLNKHPFRGCSRSSFNHCITTGHVASSSKLVRHLSTLGERESEESEKGDDSEFEPKRQ